MTETRWLSADEQRAWRAYLESSRVLFDALDRQLQRDAGIPQTYYEILVQLSEAPERALRMSTLADFTRSSRSRLSHAVDRLVERGWVERVDCPTDKRGQLARMTNEGFAALVDAAPGHVAAVRKFMIDRLTPEQIEVLEGIGTAIMNAQEQAPPRDVLLDYRHD